MALRDDLLPRVPPYPWEGWFLIGIGDADCPIRWHKTHVYRGGQRSFRYPVSAVEGLRTPEVVTFVATSDRIYEAHDPLARGALRANRREFELSIPDLLQWRGATPRFQLDRRNRGDLEMSVEVMTRDRMQWIRAPGVLTYFGMHSAARGSIAFDGAEHAFRGLGILEHAWGGWLPFDPVTLIRGPWHWDVLAFDGGDGAAVGAMSLPLPVLGSRGVRAGGRVPGHEFCAFRDFSVEVLDTAGGVPLRWRGRMTSERGGELSYEAAAATPVAVAARGVHFLGTEFTASYRGQTFEGRGFTECGGPV